MADWCVSPEFLSDNMMGPNSMAIVQELLQGQKLTPGMRVLDLGCGRGLTSVYLAKTYGVQVFAADLWISATENYQRFRSLGLENQSFPFMQMQGSCLLHRTILMRLSAWIPTITSEIMIHLQKSICCPC